jgi:hypothetical protein
MPLKAAIVPVTLFQQNCTLIWDEVTKAGAVVDPGGDLDRIEAGIAKTGMTVEKILLTHGHVDHAAGAAELREKLGGIPIEGPHIADKFLLDSLPGSAASFGMEGARVVTPDRWLDDGDKATVAGATFAILHCPGRRPDLAQFLRRRLTVTPLRAEVSVRTEIDCEPPEVVTTMEPAMLPLNRSRRLEPDASPDTPPATLKLRSSQVPDTRLPLKVRLARSSMRLDGLAQRSARPSAAPPPLGT